MNPIIWQGIATGGLFVLNRLTDWALSTRTRNTPPAPQRFEVARADDGTPMPMFYGRCRIDSPNLVWHGNHLETPVPGGYAYHLDMLFVLGVPQYWDLIGGTPSTGGTKLTKIWWGDLEVSFANCSHGQGRSIDKQALFGDTGFGGGLGIDLQFFDGRSTQDITSSKIKDRIVAAGGDATLIPNYRYQAIVGIFATPVGSGSPLGIGESPRLPQISFELSKPYGSNLPNDANPAMVIYDILVGQPWKCGFLAADIDTTSFNAARDTLNTEGHGYSNVFYQGDDARRILQEICDQIDAVLFEDPSTSKVVLKLIRADYDPNAVPVMTFNNTIGIPQTQGGSREDTVNEVIVQFTERARDHKQGSVRAQKEANIAGGTNNRRRTATIHYPGCCTRDLANKLAARELHQLGRPTIAAQAKVNREFFATKPGDVVKANWGAPLNITGKLFRVQQVNLGQLADGAIMLHLVEEVFGATTGAFPGDPGPDATPITLLPLTKRYASEAPWLLQYFAFNAGQLPNLTDQRVLAAAAEENDLADVLRGHTQSGGLTGILTAGALPDVPQQFSPTTATVETLYPATAGPYDTTTGLRVSNVGGELAAKLSGLAATATEIAEQGKNLALVGDELIAFESVTTIGGGVFRLNNVHRELLDTVAVDHAVGERLYLIDTDQVGRRAWPLSFQARVFAIPSYKTTVGSGDVHGSDDLTIAGRAARELRVADFRVGGYDLDGTAGIPSTAQTYPLLGDFRALSRLEGDVIVTGRQRTREHGKAVRGDDTASYPAAAGTTWDLYGQKVGEAEVAITGFTGLSSPAATGALFGEVGHGAIDLILHTVNASKRSWQSPRIRATAPTWRDLLANGSADHNAMTPGWTSSVGTVGVQSGTSSLSRRSNGRWFQASAGSDGLATGKQTVIVTGYVPRGLTALATFYARGFDGDATDTALVTIRALDAADSELSSSGSTPITAPTTHWRRSEHTLTLPASTAKVTVEITLDSDDEVVPDVGITRVQLQIGQMSSELLANPSFDAGASPNFTSWSNTSNNFVENTTNVYSSRDGTNRVVQGGAFASSEIQQEVTIPAGYEYGVALLTGARSTTISGDTGEIKLEVLDGGGAVIASATTGAEHSFPGGLDTWERRRLAVQLPDAAVKLRVRLLAVRTGGGGNSGACFDDLSLRIHKDLDPVTTRDFDFRAPVYQPMPQTWQRFHLDFPALPVPMLVWGGQTEEPSVQPSEELDGPTHAWSDAGSYGGRKYVGYWDLGPQPLFIEPTGRYDTQTAAYQLSRAAAGAAIDLQASGADADTGEEYGAFARTEAFTIAVQFRTYEASWGTAAGLVGRRDNAGKGWGLQINASGNLVAVMQGAGGTAAATAAGTVHDRAPHWAFLVNDAGANTLRLYDDHGGSATAATGAIGSIDVTSIPLRIGRDGPASGTGGLMIARVLIWRSALSASDVAAIMKYGDDPSALITTWTSNRAVWVPGPSDTAGATLLRFAADQVPIGYHGGGYGLVLAAASTNKIPTHDFTDNTKWAGEIGTTLTQALVDATGLPRGIRVANAGADQGLQCSGVTMGVGTPLGIVFYAKTGDGVASRSLVVELMTASLSLIDTETVTITPLWQRFHVQLGPWADATPTAVLRFVLGASAVGSFDLSHPIWADFGTDAPLAIQDAGLAINDTYAARAATLPVQLNYEGELYIEGIGTVATPPATKTFASVDNNTNANGKRAVTVAAAAAPRFTLTNNAGSATDTSGTAISWAVAWKLRGRWNKLELPESLTKQQGLEVDGDVDSKTYTANAFSVGSTGLAAIRIGGGDPNGSATPNALLGRVIVRAREPKVSG